MSTSSGGVGGVARKAWKAARGFLGGMLLKPGLVMTEREFVNRVGREMHKSGYYDKPGDIWDDGEVVGMLTGMYQDAVRDWKARRGNPRKNGFVRDKTEPIALALDYTRKMMSSGKLSDSGKRAMEHMIRRLSLSEREADYILSQSPKLPADYEDLAKAWKKVSQEQQFQEDENDRIIDYRLNHMIDGITGRGQVGMRNPRKKAGPKYLRDMETPVVLGVELDRRTLTPVRRAVDLTATGDWGADPLGDGMFRMIPSGDVVDFEERNRRLKR